MDILAEIKQKLQKYPAAHYELEGNTLSVLPDSDTGFTVSITDHGGSYTVGFDAWHEEFTDADEAMNCFALGLSEDCRLQEWRRGNSAYKWTMEYRDDNQWIGDSTTSLFFSEFWKPAVVVYLQHHLIPPRETES